MKRINTFENFLNENLNESKVGLILNDLLNKMAMNTKLIADVLTIIKLAKEDKEGNAEKAVELMMKNHGLSKEVALEAVTRIFKNAFEWVKESLVNEAVKEVVLSNEILDFLQERGVINGSDAQKVHKDLTTFLKEKL